MNDHDQFIWEIESSTTKFINPLDGIAKALNKCDTFI